METLEEKYLKLLAEYEQLQEKLNNVSTTRHKKLEQCESYAKAMVATRTQLVQNIKEMYKSWLPPKVHSFLSTMKAWKQKGFKKSEYADKRFDICKSCDFLKNETTCTLCGCYMKSKTKIKGAKCPIDKWKKIEDTKT